MKVRFFLLTLGLGKGEQIAVVRIAGEGVVMGNRRPPHLVFYKKLNNFNYSTTRPISPVME